MKLVKNLNRLFLVFSTALVAGMLPAAHAQDAKPGCDPQFMDAMEAKAYLGVQRRITQNQNFILKPDSVLEYSCFNQHIGYIAANEGRRFSEDDQTWGDITGIGDETQDYALYEVVTEPLLSYLGGNFSNTFLGGRMVDPGGAAPAPGTYDCKAMQAVWKAARCIDFMEDQDEFYVVGDDGFYDFPWYADNDPRRIPPEFGACASPTNIDAAITNVYESTGDDSGQEYKLFVQETENPADENPYEEDPMTVQKITDAMLPGDCGESLKIPTGVMVDIPRRTAYQENVCLTPACSYDGSACTSE